MSTAMTEEERDAFLADLHVGVISVEQDGRPPLSAPIWYDYAPGVGVWVITGDASLKAMHLKAAGRFTLVAQDEAPPAYRYVSVEGPIIETRKADLERDLRPMARRYVGDEIGDQYTDATGVEAQAVYVMRPERWRTVDYGKAPLL
ncbi:MAG: pyridoxamine 5'-phosphate oxidase family protein [Myxococcota bacterium]